MTILEKIFPSDIHQWTVTIVFIGFVFTVLLTVELIYRIFSFNREIIRKFVHFIISILIILFSYYLDSAQPLTFTAFIFTITNIIIIYFNFFPSIHTNRNTYGIVFYSLSVFFLSFILLPDYHFIFLNAMLILSISDPFAAIIGQNLKKVHIYKNFIDKKSLEGSVAMGISTFLILIITFIFFNNPCDFNFELLFIYLVLIALMVSIAESFSAFGSDNLSLAATVSLLLYIFLYDKNDMTIHFVEAFFFSILFLAIAFYFRLIKPSGAFAALFLAVFIFGIGQWLWTIPILVFFISSSFLSKIGKSRKNESELFYEKSSSRDAVQVFANGGIALLAILFFFFTQNEYYFYAYLISLAAANADTWATEIGGLSKKTPILITNFKPVKKGRSGAISLIGTSAAFFGSLLIAITGKILFQEMTVKMVILISASGFLGSIVDSLLGATLQAQYLSEKSGKITEKKEGNQLFSGYAWLNNDMVNFISILSSVIFFVLLNLY